MMKSKLSIAALLFLAMALPVTSSDKHDREVIKTSKGDLEITCVGHGSLMFKFDGKVIHIDPFSKMGDYSAMPKADLVLITHEHSDHLDTNALKLINKESAVYVMNAKSGEIWKPESSIVMSNGQSIDIMGIKIEAVPAYNIKHKRPDGNPFHPKGEGNGYILTMGGKRIYAAGDTENIPEMKTLKNIDAAFLPMNLPYTMTPEMTADAAKGFKPKILFPYHYGETNTEEIKKLMKSEKNIEVKIRRF
ncbi:MAG: MBL fold metallo-hydrolase [Chitinispirillales bacterium]|jgi:L-ascorbate metabolism protein UlaG (beta-lactamase superfamily)|nr:MBL fold metallo-hydrolase [Chitinispirillales bacterium]